MKIGDSVRFYEGSDASLFHDDSEWFVQGEITDIDDKGIEVDFMNWVSILQPSDINVEYFLYVPTLVTSKTGVIIKDYRE